MNKDLTVGNPQTVLWKFCMPLFGSIFPVQYRSRYLVCKGIPHGSSRSSMGHLSLSGNQLHSGNDCSIQKTCQNRRKRKSSSI